MRNGLETTTKKERKKKYICISNTKQIRDKIDFQIITATNK